MEGTVEMDAGFLVDRDPISASFDKFGDEEVRILDHKVAIEGDLELLAE